jgi:hypothetical protein
MTKRIVYTIGTVLFIGALTQGSHVFAAAAGASDNPAPVRPENPLFPTAAPIQQGEVIEGGPVYRKPIPPNPPNGPGASSGYKRDQTAQADAELRAAQKALEKSQFELKKNLNFNWVGIPGHEENSAVSVLSFGQPDQKTMDETAEDLKVLSFILMRSLEAASGGEQREYKLGIPLMLKSGGHSVQASYVEDFGVLLNVRVSFPVVVSAAGENNRAESEKTSSQWEEARRALAGEASQPVPQDWARLIEGLKTRIVDVLKNASNLRHVKPDQWVAVCITGTPSAGGRGSERISVGGGFGTSSGGTASRSSALKRSHGQAARSSSSRSSSGSSAAPAGEGENFEAREFTDESRGESKANRATVMTVRVKKSVADAFAAGKISATKFADEAKVTTYLGPAASE